MDPVTDLHQSVLAAKSDRLRLATCAEKVPDAVLSLKRTFQDQKKLAAQLAGAAATGNRGNGAGVATGSSGKYNYASVPVGNFSGSTPRTGSKLHSRTDPSNACDVGNEYLQSVVELVRGFLTPLEREAEKTAQRLRRDVRYFSESFAADHGFLWGAMGHQQGSTGAGSTSTAEITALAGIHQNGGGMMMGAAATGAGAPSTSAGTTTASRILEEELLAFAKKQTELHELVRTRDGVLSKLVYAVLYEYAVLDWDLQMEREFKDPVMADLHGYLSGFHVKNGCVLDKVPAALLDQAVAAAAISAARREEAGSSLGAAGSTSADAVSSASTASTTTLPPFASFLATLLRESDLLQARLRTEHLGKTTTVEKQSIACSELRKEAAHFFRKAERLELELQEIKAAKFLAQNKAGMNYNYYPQSASASAGPPKSTGTVQLVGRGESEERQLLLLQQEHQQGNFGNVQMNSTSIGATSSAAAPSSSHSNNEKLFHQAMKEKQTLSEELATVSQKLSDALLKIREQGAVVQELSSRLAQVVAFEDGCD
eukprot:g18503.t1